MKKTIVLITFCLLGLNAIAQQDKTWRLGVQWGFQGNHSSFSGGAENANARFQQNPFGGVALSLIARYDYTKHWMFMTGLGISTFGFEFTLSENYSLLKNRNHLGTPLRNEFGSFEIPAMAYYKCNPNCKNSKFVIGAGFAYTLIGAQSSSKNYTNNNEGNTNANSLKSESVAKGGVTCMLRFSVGREKIFKRGNMLNASMLFNLGFKELATANVTYKVEGQDYQHNFVNKGNFVGFRLTYFFKSFSKQ